MASLEHSTLRSVIEVTIRTLIRTNKKTTISIETREHVLKIHNNNVIVNPIATVVQNNYIFNKK